MSSTFVDISSGSENKIVATLKICHFIGIPVDDLLNTYSGQVFDESKLEKLTVYSDLLKERKVSTEFTEYAQKRLGTEDLVSFRDSRNALEYAVDLLLGWIVEDAFVEWCLRNGIDARLSGKDSERELQSNSNSIDSNSDIYLKDSERRLEIVQDHTGFWIRQGVGHLRNDKLDKLLEQRSVLIGISEECVFWFDLGDYSTRSNLMSTRAFIQNHKHFGNKPAWEIPFNNPKSMSELKDFLSGL